jgi:hypothetical protein
VTGASIPWTRSNWLDLLELALTVIGFGLAIWQLLRTARATEATRDAVRRTEKRMAKNHLLVLLPQFRILEHDLDAAAEDNDRKLAIRTLVAYNQIAGEVAGLLDGQDDIDQDLAKWLHNAATSASRAKADMINNPKKQAKTATRVFRQELAVLSTQIVGLASRYQLEPEAR